MNKKLFLVFIVPLLLLVAAPFAPIHAQKKYVADWVPFDFSKKVIKKADLTEYELSDLQIIRGIVFGKRGRIFKEQSIQDYISKQKWYKPNAKFTNALLTPNERKNIDIIREAEAEKHETVEPGDLRFWEKKLITEDILRDYSGAEWRIMIAEIEAIRGKRFDDEEWLQKYFEERYWYKPAANYSATVLTEIERKNLTLLNEVKNKSRKAAVSPGDMEIFQKAPLREEQLIGNNLNDLRLMRSEIFARHGKTFTVAFFKTYFEWQDWYKPVKDQSKIKLNATEEANVKVIQSYEAKLRERISNELLTEDDVSGLHVEDLRTLRNEIYARHGRIFSSPKSKDLQKYFESQSWYKPNPDFKDDQLTETEFKNISIIKQAEEVAISKFMLVEG